MLSLDELESRLQTLLEVHLVKYLPGYKPEDMVYQQLALAMQNSLKEQDGITYAPNVYVIVAHPSTVARWLAAPHLIEKLAEVLQAAGDEAGFQFFRKPTLTTTVDTQMTPHETHIIASFSNENIAETRRSPIGQQVNSTTDVIPPNAFLILGGTKIIPLNQSVINIGRRLDNQVVIDDPRVSRTHAQLRVSKGRFVLFDLNSTGGTFINGQRTNQSILTSGDVISLAGINLIFGQDLPTGQHFDTDATEPKSTISTDRATAILSKPKKEKKKKANKR
jgi:pSer/pThr/pTyr-binding forkhead associated (FHA) protein